MFSDYLILQWRLKNKIHMSDFRDFRINENDNSFTERIMWQLQDYLHMACYMSIICCNSNYCLLYKFNVIDGSFLSGFSHFCWGRTNCVCMFSSNRHKTILRRDGATVKVSISARVVSYSIALWSGVAAFTIWAGHETNIPVF